MSDDGAMFTLKLPTFLGIESDKTTLTNELERSKTDYSQFRTEISRLAEATPIEGIVEKYSEDLYKFLLKDSKVPSAVLSGIGQFIDFKKYLGLAIETGAKEVRTGIEGILGINRGDVNGESQHS